MTNSAIIKCIGVAGALALWAGGAQAATYDLTLIGDATDSTTVSVPYPGNRIDEITTIPLSLANGGALPTVSDNNSVDVTADIINGPVAVAASNAYNGISVGFFAYVHGTTTYIGPSNTTVGSTLSASLLGTTTFPLSPSGATTVEQIISNVAISYPPDNAFSFDQVLSNMVITDNGAGGQPADLISAYLEIDQVNGVPEPATSAMLLLGFAGLGIAGYRSRKPLSIAA